MQKQAIDSYIAHDIDPNTWHIDVNHCWERAARLCKQIKDTKTLEAIKYRLFSALQIDYSSSEYMVLCMAELMDKINIDSGLENDIVSRLMERGNQLSKGANFYPAISYFELSSKKAKQNNDDDSWLKSLLNVASCWELEGDARIQGSDMAATHFYNKALQAYRSIPQKHRDSYSVNDKINAVQQKLSASGKASLNQMGTFEIPFGDMADLTERARNHVTGKPDFKALLYFTGLNPWHSYSELRSSAEHSKSTSLPSHLFGSSHIASDGRTIAITPSINPDAGGDDSDNQTVLNTDIQKVYSISIVLTVRSILLPALETLLLEHRVPRAALESLCLHSAIVPDDRECLLGYALWLGFEYNFGAAIHLLCPQVEHIVRVKLQEAGVNTSHVDQDGINNEKGLSALMDFPEIIDVLGEDIYFELKSIFTDTLGGNLRNEVAHGLLDDSSSSSAPTVYAWWMILKLVVESCINDQQPDQ